MSDKKGDDAPLHRALPKIKQEVLERDSEPLTSAYAKTAKPLVVRPKTSVIRPKQLDDQKKQHTKSARRSRYVKSKYLQAAAEVEMGSTSQLSVTQTSTAKSSRELSASYSLKTLAPNERCKTLAPNERCAGETSAPGSATSSKFDGSAFAVKGLQDGNFNAETDDPEILYSRYMQYHLLNQTVKQNMREKEKKYTQELNFMNQNNIEQGEEIEELKNEVLLLQHQWKLEQQLDAQRNVVAPVADKMNSVLDSYKMLAGNLDTTQHRLPLHGTQEPDPHALEVALDETRNLLGQINILTRSQAPAIEKMAESASSLHKNCMEEIRSLPSIKADLKKGVATVLHQASISCQLKALN